MIAAMILLQAALSVSVAGPATSAEYLPLRVAEAEGYFAAENLAIALRPARSAPDSARELSQGTADLAATSLDAAIRMGHRDGQPPLLVMGLTAAPPVAVLVPASLAGAVQSPTDLAGRVVGIPAPGTPEHGVLLTLLESSRLPAARAHIESRGEAGLAAAIASGTVAAGVLGDPWATRLLESGMAVALADLRKPGAAERLFGGPTVHAAVFARAGSRLSTADLAGFVRAVARAIARIQRAPADDVARALAPAVAGLPDEFAARVAGARAVYLRDGQVSGAALARSLAALDDRWPVPAIVKRPRRPADLLHPGLERDGPPAR